LKYFTTKNYETSYLLPLIKHKKIPIPTKIPVFPIPVIELINDTIRSFKNKNEIKKPKQIIQIIGVSLEEYLMQDNLGSYL
jgi:hypothetical protein